MFSTQIPAADSANGSVLAGKRAQHAQHPDKMQQVGIKLTPSASYVQWRRFHNDANWMNWCLVEVLGVQVKKYMNTKGCLAGRQRRKLKRTANLVLLRREVMQAWKSPLFEVWLLILLLLLLCSLRLDGVGCADGKAQECTGRAMKQDMISPSPSTNGFTPGGKLHRHGGWMKQGNRS